MLIVIIKQCDYWWWSQTLPEKKWQVIVTVKERFVVVVAAVGAKCSGVPAADNSWNEIQHNQGSVVEDRWWGNHTAGLCHLQVHNTVVTVVVAVAAAVVVVVCIFGM